MFLLARGYFLECLKRCSVLLLCCRNRKSKDPGQWKSSYSPHPRNVVHATVTIAQKPRIETAKILLAIDSILKLKRDIHPSSRFHAKTTKQYLAILLRFQRLPICRMRINWLCCKYVSRLRQKR
jgi:hypothetical protein